MENPHVQWRIDFAKHLKERLLAFEGIKAIVIAGSVARDYADAYSDLELPIFWEALPDDATRHTIVAALEASFLYAYDGPAREDQLSFLQHEIFLVLLALNRSYFPTFKWLYQVIDSMPIQPVATGQRFRQAFEGSCQDALIDTKQVLQETLQLVEKQFPLIDLAPIYRRLAYVRAARQSPLQR